MSENKTSYHDVIVYCGNVKYRIADNYALQLICTKAGGWSLWQIWGDKEKLLGGEYGGNKRPFCIEVNGIVILGKKPEIIKEPKPFGWDGSVNRYIP